MKLRFPKNFIWGVGVSSHQTEGNNTNNDWWEWEQRGKTVDKSGWATDSWNRYKIDHQLAADLGCGAYRISLEWSRIEPKEGKFSEEAFEHYLKVLRDIKAQGMLRVVTLWHYTLPLWFVHKYGWHHERSVKLFTRFCKRVMETLGSEIEIVLTMNEPRLPLNRGYLLGNRPPCKRNPWAFVKARRHMVEAHCNCYDLIKRDNKKIQVGITQFVHDMEYRGSSETMKNLVERLEEFYNWYFFSQIGNKQDLIGIDYYLSVQLSLWYPFFEQLTVENKKTEMGWGVYPEGIHEIVTEAYEKYKKPVYVFENGIADRQDKQRQFFIKEHLKWLYQAIQDGADVRGYFYWSLLDNYEWEDGFSKQFGLCKVDRRTMERIPRNSYYYYQKVIRENGIIL